MTNPPLLTSREVADMLGVSLRTLGRWTKDGTIRPHFKHPGMRGPRLFDRAEVDRIKALREAQPAA